MMKINVSCSRNVYRMISLRDELESIARSISESHSSIKKLDPTRLMNPDDEDIEEWESAIILGKFVSELVSKTHEIEAAAEELNLIEKEYLAGYWRLNLP